VLRLNSKIPGIKIFRQIHLWLGLASGLVIFIVAITGAIYAFQPEITRATQPYLSVKAENKPFLGLSELKNIASKQLLHIKPTRIIFKGRDGSAVVHFFGKKPRPYYYAVYLNPYTGEVLKVKDMDTDFFRVILVGHMYLWLPQPIGHQIVIYATLIFLVMIVSGIILWWPRSKARKKSSFKVKWKASPRRLNYDLHNVFGFYACWVLVFIVATGLVWGFEWAADAEYRLFSGGRKKQKIPQPVSVRTTIPDTIHPLDKIFNSVTAAYPGVHRMQVAFPQNDSASVTVRVYRDQETYYRMDYLYFDQYTAARRSFPVWGKYEDANGGEKASRMNYDIHVGAIAGLPGRLLVFFAALIAASLPVTGFYIWWGKRKKLSGNRSVKASARVRRQAVPA
jgi:uncharacterized iron-regulated membrane protein